MRWRSRSFQLFHIRVICTAPLFAPSLSSRFSRTEMSRLLTSASCTPSPMDDPSPRVAAVVGTRDRSLLEPLLRRLALAPSEMCSGRLDRVDGSMIRRFPERAIL